LFTALTVCAKAELPVIASDSIAETIAGGGV